MSGGYTHITVVNTISEPARLETIQGFQASVEVFRCMQIHLKS